MKNTKIIPGYKTDHSAITFTFSASLARRGKGYWKFNSQLLRDFVYVEKLVAMNPSYTNKFPLRKAVRPIRTENEVIVFIIYIYMQRLP
jgi:hypothetical protein